MAQIAYPARHMNPHPRNHRLRRLGAKWAERHAIQDAQWPLPLLKFGVWEIAADFERLGKGAIMASQPVLQNIDDMFCRIGPSLWPDSKDRFDWLYVAGAYDCCEEYDRDLYFSVDVDRTVLLLRYREYMRHALGSVKSERSRTDPALALARLAQAKKGFARLQESGTKVASATIDRAFRTPAEANYRAGQEQGHAGPSDTIHLTAGTGHNTTKKSLVIDLTDDENNLAQSAATKQPSQRSSGCFHNIARLPNTEEELDEILANIKIGLRVGCFTVDATTMSFKGCYKVHDVFVLVESRLSELPSWRGKIVTGLSVWPAVDRKHSFGRDDENGFRSMIKALIMEGVKKTVVDIDCQDG